MRWVNQWLVPSINEVMHVAADRYGWKYLDGIADAFYEHGYCSSSPWVRTIHESIQLQGNANGALHPNRAGHLQAYAPRYWDASLSIILDRK